MLAILGAFVALSLAYNVDVPAGEGVDEIAHLTYTLYLKDHHALPILPFVAAPGTVLMGYHPPLYYLLAALIVTPIDTADFATYPANPHFIWIEGTGPGNRNVYLHSPLTGEDPFPYRGVALAIHVLRLFSTVQGIAALLVVYALLRRLAGASGLALVATAATAFQPSFVDVYSVAQNDGLVALFILFGTLWCFWLVERGFWGKPLPSAFAGGAALGLALLTKETTFALVPVLAVAFGLIALRSRQYRRVVVHAATVGAVAGLLAGGWYLRNLVLYGNPLAQNVYAALYASFQHTGSYTWGDFVAFVQQLRRNYWGAFGYEHILVDQRIANALWLAALVAAPGFVLSLVGGRRDPLYRARWILAVTSVGALAILFVKWSTISGGGAAHGRFFAAAMPIVDLAIVLGLARLIPTRWPIGAFAFVGAMIAFGVAAPATFILPAYRPPLAMAAELSGTEARNLTFDDQLTLRAARYAEAATPGGETSVTLYWTRAAPITADLRFRLRVLARDGAVVFDKEYWPAGGGVPTYTWPAGATYRDEVPVPIPSNVAPGQARVLLSVRTSDGAWLDENGTREVDLGRLAIADVPTTLSLPRTATIVDARFRGGIELVGYQQNGAARAGAPLDLNLFWRATNPIDGDATVSVQLLGPAGRLLAQNDSEPAHGRAPTSTWPVNQLVVDDRAIPLPSQLAAGRYQLIVALYTRPSLARLPIVSGAPTGDHLRLTDLDLP